MSRRESKQDRRFLRQCIQRLAHANSWSDTVTLIPQLAIPKLGDQAFIWTRAPGGGIVQHLAGAEDDENWRRWNAVIRPLLEAPPSRARRLRDLHLPGAAGGWVAPLQTAEVKFGILCVSSLHATSPSRLEIAQEFSFLASIVLHRNWRLEQADLARRAQNELFVAATHELKTPLTTIRLQLHSLRKLTTLWGKPIANRLLEIMDRQVVRLETIIENVLEASRIAGGPVSLTRKENTELAPLLRQVARNWNIELTMAQCTLHLELKEGLSGNWDPLRLERVFGNLLSNAIKFGRGKPIYLQLTGTDKEVQVAIEDSGVGISSTDRERIFRAFQKGSATDFPGLGLGLFITKALVEAHGGRIEALPLADGTRILVTLPRAVAPQEGPQQYSGAGPHRKAS